MKHKRLKVGTLAAALTLSLSATALASPGTGGPGASPEEIKANSDTTISILESTEKNPNISYTVPLYMTLAVVSNDATVKVPTNYGITNTTAAATGETNPPKIGVTNMSFQKLDTSIFNTVGKATDVGTSDKKNIFLTIGGEDMPATGMANELHSFVPKGTVLAISGKPKPLSGYTNLAITGQVAPVTRTNSKTTAQFRIKYTVSLLDTSGNPLGAVYAGDDRTAAGLPPFTAGH